MKASARRIFHTEKDLRPKIRELQTQLKREQRKLDRDIATIQQKCKQSEIEVKKYAQRGNMDAAAILAKEIAKSRITVSRLYQAKAQIGSVCAELDNQIAMAKMASALKQSTTVMQSMSNLVKVSCVCEASDKSDLQTLSSLNDIHVEGYLSGCQPVLFGLFVINIHFMGHRKNPISSELQNDQVNCPFKVKFVQINRDIKIRTGFSGVEELPGLQTTMKNLSKEMMKLGLMNEMVDDSIDNTLGGGEELEEKAQSEVDKILFELTNGAMGRAPDAVTDTLPAGMEMPSAAVEEEAEATADDLEEMRARLEAIR
ncbi:hypothetical protein ACTXT7_010824 [Hymenolepis weldensis]